MPARDPDSDLGSFRLMRQLAALFLKTGSNDLSTSRIDEGLEFRWLFDRQLGPRRSRRQRGKRRRAARRRRYRQVSKSVMSEPCKGSVFTVRLPCTLNPQPCPRAKNC
jgi:hypothetical protein